MILPLVPAGSPVHSVVVLILEIALQFRDLIVGAQQQALQRLSSRCWVSENLMSFRLLPSPGQVVPREADFPLLEVDFPFRIGWVGHGCGGNRIRRVHPAAAATGLGGFAPGRCCGRRIGRRVRPGRCCGRRIKAGSPRPHRRQAGCLRPVCQAALGQTSARVYTMAAFSPHRRLAWRKGSFWGHSLPAPDRVTHPGIGRVLVHVHRFP